MVRLNKLHVITLLILIAASVYGYYFMKVKRDELRKEEARLELQKAELERAQIELRKAAPPPAEPEAKAPAASPIREAASGVLTYIVRRGDTLWSIAKRMEHFGQGHRWYDIWKANDSQVFDFDRIVSGQALVIPLDKPDNYAWPKTDESRKRAILGRTRKASSKSAGGL
ncbi:MAG: hypothetical protein A2636_05900 [Elusimicrobia bacterium RIFCSPHIGHO2_01_FULL_64_10]|nr:MAG: hypothetical protein A2636_05900 [Elusimicrobia bacterium RIFCSPHIGHO2_01_FULL_64_10]